MRGERQFMRPPGRPQQSFFSDRKVITPFPKRVVVSDGAECAVGNIEKWFKEQEVTGYKRRFPSSRSEEPERKRTRRPERETNKIGLSSSATSNWPLKKSARAVFLKLWGAPPWECEVALRGEREHIENKRIK
ncbi:hypothetical protein TNCV_4948861 [Trichonephila clavipes]|nr:hypothetical protein TNCV_4948861 [Trichonephila clavipes]